MNTKIKSKVRSVSNPIQQTAIAEYERLCVSDDKTAFGTPRQAREFLSTHNRACLFKHLKNIKAKQVEVTFDGSGDSGQIESSVVDGKEIISSKKCGIVEGFISHTCTSYKPDGQIEHSWEKQVNLYQAIEDYCYNILETEHGGWEINGGSYGEFTISVKKDKLETKLVMNERYEEVTTSEETY